MTTISNEVRIDGPIATVFDIGTTARHWPLWHPATAAVDGIISRPLTLGDQVRERAVIAGRSHEGVWTVSEHTRPERRCLQERVGHRQSSGPTARPFRLLVRGA